MATLQKIRDKGTLLVIVIGAALIAFVLGDLLTSGTTLFGRAQDKAFVVNREVISTQQYADKITQFEEFQKMVSGQSSLDENVSSDTRSRISANGAGSFARSSDSQTGTHRHQRGAE